jgi:hypothetical protein
MNRPLTLEELEAAPDAAMLYLEYRLPRPFHRNGTSRADSIRAMMCQAYRAAHYGQRFRCWSGKPTPEEMKSRKWRDETE